MFLVLLARYSRYSISRTGAFDVKGTRMITPLLIYLIGKPVWESMQRGTALLSQTLLLSPSPNQVEAAATAVHMKPWPQTLLRLSWNHTFSEGGHRGQHVDPEPAVHDQEAGPHLEISQTNLSGKVRNHEWKLLDAYKSSQLSWIDIIWMRWKS